MTRGEEVLYEWSYAAFFDCDSVLSIGSMRGKYLDVLPCKRKIALDVYQPYLDAIPFSCEKILGDANVVLPHLPDAYVDGVMATDFIEHVTKDQGVVLLRHMLRLARKRVAVFTPNGFFPQDEERTGCTGEELQWQTHRSGWTIEELEALGFEVERWMYGWQDHPAGGLWGVAYK